MQSRALIAIALLGCVLASAPIRAHAQNTVRFDTTAVTVAESAGSVTVNLTIEGPSIGFGGVIVQTFDDTAVAPDDYGAVFTFVGWQPGDPATKTLTVPIVSDGLSEPDETFFLRITSGDGAEPGTPDELVVTISDAPVVPAASFVLDDEIPAGADGQGHILVEGGLDYTATLRLDQMPTSPVDVLVQVGDEPTPRTVTFDGVQERQIVIASPPSASRPLVRTALQILSSSAGASQKFFGPFVDLIHGFPADLNGCYVCVWSYLMTLAGEEFCDDLCALSLDENCIEKRAAKADPSSLPLLRRYRDEVLTTTAGGSYYRGVYDELTVEAFRAMTRDPGLAYAILEAKGPWLAAIQALVDGNGSAAIVTVDMRDDLVAIFDRLRAAGQPELDQRLAEEASRLGLDTIDGLTMDQLQARIVAAGQSVAVEPTSWGDVKARFGN